MPTQPTHCSSSICSIDECCMTKPYKFIVNLSFINSDYLNLQIEALDFVDVNTYENINFIIII